ASAALTVGCCDAPMAQPTQFNKVRCASLSTLASQPRDGWLATKSARICVTGGASASALTLVLWAIGFPLRPSCRPAGCNRRDRPNSTELRRRPPSRFILAQLRLCGAASKPEPRFWTCPHAALSSILPHTPTVDHGPTLSIFSATIPGCETCGGGPMKIVINRALILSQLRANIVAIFSI